MISPRLVMILASAGSGKTFALTNRFVALLAAGAAPERIVALTFTRKAAGEFFDGILGKLAVAAADGRKARELGEAIGRPEFAPEDFLRLLRAMVDALHRLRLGTLDSFFAQIARAFPFELGLAGDFEVIEGHAAAGERERVLRLLFARTGGALDAAQQEFLEAFKQATFGTEEKQLAGRMDRFLDRHYEKYLEAPEPELWGDPQRIWPRGQPWLREADRAAAVAALRRWLAGAEMSDGQRERWHAFAAAIEEWSVGAPWSEPMDYLLPKALAAWRELEAGAAELTIERKKLRLDEAGCAVVAELVRLVAGGELRRQVEMTRGLHTVLRRYDAIYDLLVRRSGRLTFGDVTRLLRPEQAERELSFGGDGEGRLLLDYRLDAGIDHWLLDEFQDTSRGQWSVLQNLIDEVVQDADERRTFFCVGDVKQSIYAWREGDPTLMGDIRRHYNGDQEAGPIATQPLDASWRSGPAIIEMVNTVFGAREVIGLLFPGPASVRWTRAWRDHTTERRELDGQAALLQADDAEGRKRLTLELLRTIDPLRRGLTCAVLVRANDQATELADYLRREGQVPAVAESDLAVCTDNPLGAVLLALVQAAAHPADTLAWEQVGMTPLAGALAAEGLGSREAVTRRVLAQISGEGFERFAEHWMARLPAGGEFARERARQFAGAAALFDAAGRRDPDEFIQFMTRYTLREPESAAVVRVMTIHKAKGLGFDVVILPELQGRKLNSAPEGLAVHRDAEHRPEWILSLPKAELTNADAVLGAHAEAAAGETCYEALSLLYVAMTRAKRAMYVVTEPVAAKSKSHNYPKLLAETLGAESGPVRVGAQEFGGSWSAGNPDWFEGIESAPKAGPAPAMTPLDATPVVRHVARRPSSERTGAVGAKQLFASGDRAAREFGAAVHALLAEIVWCRPEEVPEWSEKWRVRGVREDAVAHVVAALRAPSLAGLWTRPADAPQAEVWRERGFEIVLAGEWISGIFDRVVVVRDETGRAAAATVYDFKTERGLGAELLAAGERHRRQLDLYRRVVARLAGLEIGKVRAEVVLTGPGLSVGVE